MRRKEFEEADLVEVESFLQEMTFGFLSTVDEQGFPVIKPLNFAYLDGVVYFHGSRKGEKISNIERNQKVCFAVAREFAVIPSHFTDKETACPATAFFKSVLIRGKINLVEDLDEKARALSVLMEKLQPEGGYQPIEKENELYTNMLKAVGVQKLEVESMSAKFKFGQNMKQEPIEQISSGLAHRNGPQDKETLAMMKKYCPAHQ